MKRVEGSIETAERITKSHRYQTKERNRISFFNSNINMPKKK